MFRLLILSCFFLVSVVAALAGIMALVELRMWAALGWHILAMGCGVLAVWFGSDHQKIQYVLSSGARCWMVAVFGRCRGGVASFGSARPRSGAGLYEHFIDYTDTALSLAAQEDRHVLRPGHEPDLQPFTSCHDILASGASAEMKRGAILSLQRLETPEAVDLLRTALSDSDTEVRFYAAGALGAIEERLQDRLSAMEVQVARAGIHDRETYLGVAQACFDFAWFHLSSDSRRDELLQRAHGYAFQASAVPASDVEAEILLGRIQMERGELQAAYDSFSLAIGGGAEDARGRLWRAEASFRMGNYRAVRNDCTGVTAFSDDVGGRLAHVVELWASR